MSFLSAADIAEITAQLTTLRDTRSVSVVFRRAGVDLAAQTVRVERTSSYSDPETDGAEERRGDVVLIGVTDLDVEIDDKCIIDGELYRVRFVHPNRQMHTQCDIEMVGG
jgi:hypothetical protein